MPPTNIVDQAIPSPPSPKNWHGLCDYLCDRLDRTGRKEMLLTGNLLTIKAEKKEEAKESSRYASFERSFRLGDNLDAEKLTVGCWNGTASIRIPKKESARPRRIEIKT